MDKESFEGIKENAKKRSDLLNTLVKFVIKVAEKEDATPAELDAMAEVAKAILEKPAIYSSGLFKAEAAK